MSVATAKLEREIKKLPIEEMVSIHEHLIAAIHEKADAQGLDPAFRAEIEQRISEIDAGNEQGVDAFRALRKM
jgi:putative addiction module component (TIGR02574 family)